ncbi:MAG TPA: hypothetical protein VFC78_23730 [Tepidisphaeraceae bacterium]|nr:hypothetical protein [Tepidisphaeraceae bacterium]
MPLELSQSQREALSHLGNELLYLLDPETSIRYVLVPADAYERLSASIGEPRMNIDETYAAQEAVARAHGWDEPAMDAYNDYDAHRTEAR